MFNLLVNVFVMFCCNNYKSIVHNCGVEWSGELCNTPVSTALCDAVTHDTATALLTSSHSRYVSHYIIGIFVQFFPFCRLIRDARRDDEKGVKNGRRSSPSQECAKQKR